MRACALRSLAGLVFLVFLGSAHAAVSLRGSGTARCHGTQTLAAQVVDEVNRVRRAHGCARCAAQPGSRPARASTRSPWRAAASSRTTSSRASRPSPPVCGGTTGRAVARGRPARTWPPGPLRWARATRCSMWLDSPGSPPEPAAPRRWREIGVAAIFVPAAPGDFGGDDMTLVTATFGVR